MSCVKNIAHDKLYSRRSSLFVSLNEFSVQRIVVTL